MSADERKIFDNIKSPHLKYWIPVVWFSNLASKARKEGRIKDSVDLQTILNVSLMCSALIHGILLCSLSSALLCFTRLCPSLSHYAAICWVVLHPTLL